MSTTMSLNRIYEIVVLISFLYSLYLWIFNAKSKQQFYFYIYLLFVMLVDIIPVNFPYLIEFNRNILFACYILFSMVYFGTIYYQKIKSKSFRILTIIVVASLIFLNIYKIQNQEMEQLSFILVISLPVLFIYLSIFWYSYRLQNVDESRMTHNFLFWISSGLLIWSVFFIFRAIPMYFLEENDPKLLSFLITTFSVVNIITYLFFLIGLVFVKNERTS